MEAVPLIPKAKALPNLDAVPLLRELFQDEFQAVIPTKKLSQNILTSLQYQKLCGDEKETFKSVEFLENLTNRKDDVISFTENVLEAYLNHEKCLEEIRNAEKHIFETHCHFLKREAKILGNRAIQDLISLKRQPLFRPLNVDYVKKYKLLQGEAGLPLEYELNTDFRVKNFKKWKKKLETSGEEDLVVDYAKKGLASPVDRCKKLPLKSVLPVETKKIRKPRPKNKKLSEKPTEIFKAEPKIVFFTDYKLGEVYAAEVCVKNMHTKGVQFQLKPTCPDGPFRVTLCDKSTTKVFSGLSFQLTVEFTPKSLENTAEDVVIVTEDGNRILIPLIAYLEPPILKTHKEINEFTKITSEKIDSSYIECGACFTGDTKVTKLRFRCYRGSGEFFIMSSENWSRSFINTVTFDNLLEIPPFQVYPVYFKMEKDEVIDLFVEFKPKNSGMHVESIVIVCDNGEIRFLDLLGDAVGWHSYYFSFQDFLLKTLPVEKDDDVKVKYYLDFEDCTPTGKVEKVFCVCNNSNMPFEFQWKIREANIQSQEKYMKLSKFEVKIDPENGTIEPNSIWEFIVTITFSNADIGNYRMVLSLYVLNLPYQCIEEDNTIIQPTGLVRNLYSQSLYGEEEGLIGSPELASLQGTYESLQESIKSYVECQSKAQSAMKNDFCRMVCIPNPGLCAKPLKKSKTFFNIGDNLEDEGLSCVCRLRTTEPESNSESCISNMREEKTNESSAQRNEIIWDFVDVLVDEVELCVEVVPIRVTLEPSVIELGNHVRIHNPPIFKKVRIVNHNRSPVTCSWILPEKITTKNEQVCEKNNVSLSLIFDKNYDKKEKGKQKFSKSSPEPLENDREEVTNQKEENFNENLEQESINNKKQINESCRFVIKPEKTFTLAGCSEHVCEIGISVQKSGNLKEILCLSVNDGDLELNLLILGTVEAEKFETSPEILNFGVLKQGGRYTKNFKIMNRNRDPLFWKIKTYKLNFTEEKFPILTEVTYSENLKKNEGVAQSKQITESFSLDAREPGIKCMLLELKGIKKKAQNLLTQYIFVVANVEQPQLLLSAPRFANAILCPAGALYVGQKFSTIVTLTNISPVETFFTWGHTFGCHSRKIKVDIDPKTSRIEKNKKCTISVELTGLEEGIISHCYIPCFFCRGAEPIILSIVALVENVNVTFEIIDYPLQTHADSSTFVKSPFHHTVLRVSWPVKIYNPTLNIKYLPEENVISMKCQCLEVEEEATRAFGEQKQELVPESDACAKSVQSLASFETAEENTMRSKCSMKKNSKTIYEEDLKLCTPVLSGYAESKKSEENSQSISVFAETFSESLRIVKSELEFLNVPFRTPILRQFVIRNETPIPTSFNINVLNYGVEKNSTWRRLEVIKNKVMGHSKDGFENQLPKGQPLVLVVKPSQGILNGYDAVGINVFCYGNTWGEYRDTLICQIKGIEPFHLKTFIQIVGHPIYFPMFKTQSTLKPVLWFQPLSRAEGSASKVIKVVNRSAISLNVSWIVFLTKPFQQEEEQQEEALNSYVESNPSVEDSLKSSKNYIPKNTSESVSTFRNAFEMTDSSQNSGEKSFEKTMSSPGKKENRESNNAEKIISNISFNEEVKSNGLPGRRDTKIFQVEPKNLDFEPFEEKNITVTFNPYFGDHDSLFQEFEAVLTACVKLKPEDEKCLGVYYRPCGINFVSELIDFNAAVETPLVSFEILRGDLKFTVDSNAVIKSPSKLIVLSRKFLIRNKNQKSLLMKIEIVPGVLFKIANITTIDKFYPKYNPDKHILKMEPGHLLEMELHCSVSYKDVMYAFEQLKLNRNKNQLSPSTDDKKNSPDSNSGSKAKREEPWNQCFDHFDLKRTKSGDRSLSHKDSFEINLNRMSSSKSDNSVCYDYLEKTHYGECEGEFLGLEKMSEEPCLPKPFQHKVLLEEEISFVQSGVVTQTLVAELHLSFPALKVSPKNLDFGNVYLGETAVRYCSLINLTGFPTDFRVKAKCSDNVFTADPLTGSLPSTNYNSDIGITVTVKFRPPQPGYFKEIFYVYCNLNFEFDFFELFVSGFGTWNEKFKTPKIETYTKLQGIYPKLQQ